MDRAKYALAIPGLLLAAAPAQAYIGPGGGLSALGALLALLALLAVAFVGFVWYPIRRMRRHRRDRAATEPPPRNSAPPPGTPANPRE